MRQRGVFGCTQAAFVLGLARQLLSARQDVGPGCACAMCVSIILSFGLSSAAPDAVAPSLRGRMHASRLSPVQLVYSLLLSAEKCTRRVRLDGLECARSKRQDTSQGVRMHATKADAPLLASPCCMRCTQKPRWWR